MYGGALLIREVTRRTGRGWRTIVVLALAFGVLQEALLTQSLFNPDYCRADLPNVGFVPSLGIAIPWTIFVLSLHTYWSIGTPIAWTRPINSLTYSSSENRSTARPSTRTSAACRAVGNPRAWPCE